MNARERAYAHHGPCPECGKRAIREQASFWRGALGSYECDACGVGFDDFKDIRGKPDGTEEVWAGSPVNKKEPGRIESAFQWVLHGISSQDRTYKEKQAKHELDRELTPKEKSKKHLSSACFVMGLMFCVTIVGIPIGLLFFVLAAVVAPDFDEEE